MGSIIYFVAQGLNLTRNNGYFSFVVPDRLGFNSQFVQLRKRILTEAQIISLVYKVLFPGITADTLIFVMLKQKPKEGNLIDISEDGKAVIQRSQTELLQHSTYAFEYFENPETMQLVAKMDSWPGNKPIRSICDSTSGFGGKSHLLQGSKTCGTQIPTLKGDSIGRYEMRKVYWFDFRKENITGRTTDATKLGASPKILLRKTGDRLIATYDASGLFPEQSLYFLFENRSKMDLKFLLGILNSRLLTVYYRAKSLTNKRSIAQVKKVDLDQLPVAVMDFCKAQHKARHDKMVSLVEQMLDLQKQLAAVKTPDDRTRLQRQIDATDRLIDQLVYDLYGLTKEEVEMVEGATKGTEK